jgi:hypothetical protein
MPRGMHDSLHTAYLSPSSAKFSDRRGAGQPARWGIQHACAMQAVHAPPPCTNTNTVCTYAHQHAHARASLHTRAHACTCVHISPHMPAPRRCGARRSRSPPRSPWLPRAPRVRTPPTCKYMQALICLPPQLHPMWCIVLPCLSSHACTTPLRRAAQSLHTGFGKCILGILSLLLCG